MKVGDLVSWNGKLVIITEVYESKCWRTDDMGKKINWSEISSEPFARILFEGNVRGVPQVDLVAVDETR